MKIKNNIKTIITIAIFLIISLIFSNICLATGTAKVIVNTANIRKTADANSTIIEQVFKNQEVQIIEKTGDWYKVKYNNIEGYLRQDLVEVANDQTDASQTQNTNLQNNETSTNQTSTNQETNNQTSTGQETSAQTSTNQETNNQTTTGQEANNQISSSQEENNQTSTNQETSNQTATEEIPNTAQQNSNETVGLDSNKTTNKIGMYTTKEAIKLKIIPLINGYDIKEITQSTTVNVLEINNNWALVESGLDRGWVIFNKLQNVEENIPTDNAEATTNTEANAETTTDENTNQEAETNIEQTEQNTQQSAEQNTEQSTEQNTEQQEEKTVEVQEKTMYVNSDVVNLRKEASTSSEVLKKLSKAKQVTVVSEENGWSKVKVDGVEGYISSSLLSETKPNIVTSRSIEEARKELINKEASNSGTEQTTNSSSTSDTQTVTSTSDKGAEVVAYAKKYLGCKYVYGGTSPSGFDCSGFTQYVYKQFGVSLNRTAEAQASNGTAVSKSELKAGDLVIFTSHVGIYAGDGTFIHAANERKGVTTTSMSDSYYVANYITARRIFN